MCVREEGEKGEKGVRRWSLIFHRGSPLTNLPVSFEQKLRSRDVIGASANAEMSPEMST